MEVRQQQKSAIVILPTSLRATYQVPFLHHEDRYIPHSLPCRSRFPAFRRSTLSAAYSLFLTPSSASVPSREAFRSERSPSAVPMMGILIQLLPRPVSLATTGSNLLLVPFAVPCFHMTLQPTTSSNPHGQSLAVCVSANDSIPPAKRLHQHIVPLSQTKQHRSKTLASLTFRPSRCRRDGPRPHSGPRP